MTLIQPHTDYAYLNNDGLIALSIGFNDANATVIRIPASGTIDPNQTYFPSAPDFVRILLYADGSIESYESNDQGSHMLLNYADIPALSLSYGHNAAYSSGPLVSSDITSASGYRIVQHFDAGHMTAYDFVYNDIHLTGQFANGRSTVSLQSNTYSVVNKDLPGNIDNLIGKVKLISQDGSTVISNDGGSLISQDGSTIVGVISNDGGSLQQALPSTLIGNAGGVLIRQDALNIISEHGAGVLNGLHFVADDGTTVATLGSNAIGNDGLAQAANTMAFVYSGTRLYSFSSLTGTAFGDTFKGRDNLGDHGLSNGPFTFTGGPGNDVYYVSSGDTVIEAPNQGTDEVRTTTSFTLPANVENLTLLAGDSNTQTFDDMSVGPITNGENGWLFNSTPSSRDEGIVVGPNGTHEFKMSSDPSVPDFAGPYSPALGAAAGEPDTGAQFNSQSFHLIFRR